MSIGQTSPLPPERPSLPLTTDEYAAIHLLVLDVDGVMTDGSIMLDDRGVETKRYHVRDGFAIKLWQRLGFQVAIITGRSGQSIEHRAKELGIVHLVQASKDKGAELSALLARLDRRADEAAFLGDDWPDLPAMARVKYPMAVGDAHPDVLSRARFVAPSPGGRGAVRDAVEHILERKGLLDQARRLYTG